MSIGPPTRPLAGSPPTSELSVDSFLVRIYNPSHGDWDAQRFYGPSDEGRFDHHPAGPPVIHADRSVWYAGKALRGAVAEAFGKAGQIDTSSNRMLVMARVVAPIRVLDLLGTGPRKLGLTHEISSTTDYGLTQSWARAFYDEYGDLEGVQWSGREINSVNVLLHDRAEMDRLVPEFDDRITHPDAWPRVARAARDCAIQIV